MAELKPGWRRVKFGDVVRQVKNKVDPATSGIERVVRGEHMNTDDLRIRRWEKVGDDYLGPAFHMRFQPGQVLYGSRRTYLRKVALADFEGITANTTFVVETRNPDVLLPELLPFIMSTESFHDHSVKQSKGSVNPYVNFSDLAWYEFALPPLEEQRRIARALQAAESVVQATTDALEALERLRDATLVHLLEKGTRGVSLVDTPIGPRPVGWEVLPVEARYEVQLGKMLSEKNQSEGERRPYIRNANIGWSELDLSDVAKMRFSTQEIEKFELRENDVLACEGRHVGKSAIWRGEIAGACYQKAVHRLRRRHGTDEPKFMLHSLRYQSATGRLVRHTTGSTIPHLPAKRLKAIQMAFPPLEEQREIIAIVEELDTGASDLKSRGTLARATMQSIHTRGEVS